MSSKRLRSIELNSTVLNNEITSVGYRVRSPTEVRITRTGIRKGYLTVSGYSEVTVVLDHAVGSRASLALAYGLSIEIKRYSLVLGNYQRVFQSDVAKQFDCIARLSRFNESC